MPCLVLEGRVQVRLPPYNLRVYTGEPAGKGGPRIATGFAIQTDLTLGDTARAGILIVPS